MAYGAYNTRTIYLFSVALIVIGIATMLYRNHPVRTRLLAISAFSIGVAIACAPQVLINKKNYGSLSPAVISTVENRSLFANQLLWGITLQRYETSVDKNSPGPAVFYLDKAGELLFKENNIGKHPFGVKEYLVLALRNPIAFIGIYGRHLVNGLDLRDGDVYTIGQTPKRSRRAVFNFMIVFLGITIMVTSSRPGTNRIGAERFFWFFVAILPVLMVLPGAIETRFFLPIHLAIYCAIALGSDASTILSVLRKHGLLTGLIFLLSIAIFFSVSTTTMSSQQYTYPDLYRGIWR